MQHTRATQTAAPHCEVLTLFKEKNSALQPARGHATHTKVGCGEGEKSKEGDQKEGRKEGSSFTSEGSGWAGESDTVPHEEVLWHSAGGGFTSAAAHTVSTQRTIPHTSVILITIGVFRSEHCSVHIQPQCSGHFETAQKRASYMSQGGRMERKERKQEEE